jgi:Protein of unknown function (DUF3592)
MPRPSPQNLFLIVWLTGWSIGTFALDSGLGAELYNQHRSASFSAAQGQITHSRLIETPSRRGPMYGAEITYSFTAGPVVYTGTRLRYNPPDLPEPRDLVDQYKVDTPVTVYYDPANPRECVLSRGLAAPDAATALLALPVHAAWLLVFFILLGEAFHIGPAAEPPRPANRLPDHPLLATLVALFITSILSIITLRVTGWSINPLATGAAWALVTLAAATTFLRTRARQHRSSPRRV